MSYRKVQNKGGNSFLTNDETGMTAISFTKYVEKNNFDNKTAKQKRQNILTYLQTHNDNEYVIRYSGRELYLTPEGEKFFTVCNHAFNNDRVTKQLAIVKSTPSTIEKLDTGEMQIDEKNEHINRAEELKTALVNMASHTNNPFSISKSYKNPYDEQTGKRVFIDLYRNVNGVHEGYIVLPGHAGLERVLKHVVEMGRFAAMRKKYGDNIRLYVIATSFDEKAISCVKLNFFNVECKTLLKMGEELVLEARKYYEEADACFKLKDWGKRYASVFSGGYSSKNETGTPHLVDNSFFSSSSASFSRASLSNMSSVVAFSAKSL